MRRHVDEERFGFGANWARFLRVLDEDRIQEAEFSLREMLDVEDLAGRTFLDAGSGSGLFSLAAARLGARRVHSFDYDPESVACTLELKRRHRPDDDAWTVERGDVLDDAYLETLGQFDVVYSWGMLHHTGDLWAALSHLPGLVAPNGRLFIAIYNDQGVYSRLWGRVKRRYNTLPQALRAAYVALVMAPFEARALARAVARGRPRLYVDEWVRYRSNRGMSRWRDAVDWVGGYPFEVAGADEIFEFYRRRGFTLTRLRTSRGYGNNEFVFARNEAGATAS